MNDLATPASQAGYLVQARVAQNSARVEKVPSPQRPVVKSWR
jgi:hypothetical protein